MPKWVAKKKDIFKISFQLTSKQANRMTGRLWVTYRTVRGTCWLSARHMDVK